MLLLDKQGGKDPLFSEQAGYKGLHGLKLKRLENGLPVYDLSMLNPDIPPARSAIDKLVQASLKGFNHKYGVSRGIKRLREAFSEKYKSAFAADIDPSSEICVTLGCKDATLHLFRIISSIKRDIVVFDPCYPPYLSAAQYHGVGVRRLNWPDSESQALADLEREISSAPISAVVLNFPMNPTGETVSGEFWQGLVALAKKHSILIVNDFAYGELVHAGSAISLLSVPGAKDVGVEIYTMSKAYNVPGWRVAAVCGNPDIVQYISNIKSKVDYGMFLPVQVAAAGVLMEGAEIARSTKDTYYRRLRVLNDGLKNIGWDCSLPKAGGSLWIKPPAGMLEKLSPDGRAVDLATEILAATGVAVLAGDLFGDKFTGYVRMAAVISEDKIREALLELERIG